MADGNTVPLGGIFTTLQQDGEDVEIAFPGTEDEEDLDKTLAVERFGDLISKTVLIDQENQGRSYNERDFEFHRQTSHHIHHPLSTHLPPPHKSQKRLLSSDRKKKKKKRKPKKTSVPPSDVTPTIQEVEEEEEEEEEDDEEEAESEGEELLEKEASVESEASLQGDSHVKVKAGLAEGSVEFTIGSDEEEEGACGSPCTLTFHVAEECSHLSPIPCLSDLLPEKKPPSPKSFPGCGDHISRGWEKRKPWSQVPSGQRANYDLKERVCIGSMTTTESATYQRIPTDEAEAQMLASADLDDMKSEIQIGALPVFLVMVVI